MHVHVCEAEMHTFSYLGEYLDGYLELGANLKVPSKSGGLLLGILADKGSHLQSLTTRNTNIYQYYITLPSGGSRISIRVVLG